MNTRNYVERLGTYTDCLENVKTIAISGHIRPDGDCVGSCLGLCTYILDQYPDMRVDVYLDPIAPEFTFLKNSDKIRQAKDEDITYDLCIALDCSDLDRLNRGQEIFKEARKTLCIDHHITNEGYGDVSVVYPQSSSASELIYQLLKQGQLFGKGKITKECAEALYMGIVHDTGVFKHSNTSLEAMTSAGELIQYGLNTEKIINDTFFKKTYTQNQILGKALLESMLVLDGRMIFTVLFQKDFQMFEAGPEDTNGVIDQIRVTEGIHVALFLYETEEGKFKVSLRSDDKVDVSAIAKEFGGGGHIRAAGCTMNGPMRDIVNNIAERVEYQLNQEDNNTSVYKMLGEQEEV